MFPTLTEAEFVSIKSAVCNLAAAWLNTPLASRHPDGRDDAPLAEAMDLRRKAFRVQLDAMNLKHMGEIVNTGQLQCVTRFLAENIAGA